MSGIKGTKWESKRYGGDLNPAEVPYLVFTKLVTRWARYKRLRKLMEDGRAAQMIVDREWDMLTEALNDTQEFAQDAAYVTLEQVERLTDTAGVDALSAADAAVVQRFPGAMEKWRGMTNKQLTFVMLGLESDTDRWSRQQDRDYCEALWRDADAEMTRRGIQPEDRPENEEE